jgi:hypothetical protein
MIINAGCADPASTREALGNQPPTRCSRCGAELPPHLPSGLCPKCLLEAGLGTQPQFGPEEIAVLQQSAARKGMPQPDEQFAHYRLERLLGQGGMGGPRGRGP